MAPDGTYDRDAVVVHRKNEGYKAWSLVSNTGLRINEKCRYEGVIALTVLLYGAEAWGTRSAGKRKLDVLEMNYLRSLVECHEWIELGMKRYGLELESERSSRVE